MIKINLNRTRVPGNAGGGGEDTTTQMATNQDFGGGPNPREVIVKVVVMLVGIVGLAIYQKQNIDQLDAQLAAVMAQVSNLKAEVAKKKAELLTLKDIEPKANALNDKLKILREFSKLRLFQLQSLDFLQSVIPVKVWL